MDKYGAARIDAACRRALSFDLINTKRVERIVLHALEDGADHRRAGATTTPVLQLPLRFLRTPDNFTHHPDQEDPDRGDSTLS